MLAVQYLKFSVKQYTRIGKRVTKQNGNSNSLANSNNITTILAQHPTHTKDPTPYTITYCCNSMPYNTWKMVLAHCRKCQNVRATKAI